MPLPPPEATAPHERIIAVAREMFCRDGIHATGVDRISIGRLTKDVKAIDFSMRIIERF